MLFRNVLTECWVDGPKLIPVPGFCLMYFVDEPGLMSVFVERRLIIEESNQHQLGLGTFVKLVGVGPFVPFSEIDRRHLDARTSSKLLARKKGQAGKVRALAQPQAFGKPPLHYRWVVLSLIPVEGQPCIWPKAQGWRPACIGEHKFERHVALIIPYEQKPGPRGYLGTHPWSMLCEELPFNSFALFVARVPSLRSQIDGSAPEPRRIQGEENGSHRNYGIAGVSEGADEAYDIGSDKNIHCGVTALGGLAGRLTYALSQRRRAFQDPEKDDDAETPDRRLHPPTKPPRSHFDS